MTKGIRVVQVYPDTPAQKAGIRAGDLLFRMDGQIINAYRTEDAEIFGNMIKEYKTDATVRFTGLRKKKALDLSVTLEKRPAPPNELPEYKEETFEFTVRELSFGDRVNIRLKDDHPGLLIHNVEPRVGHRPVCARRLAPVDRRDGTRRSGNVRKEDGRSH